MSLKYSKRLKVVTGLIVSIVLLYNFLPGTDDNFSNTYKLDPSSIDVNLKTYGQPTPEQNSLAAKSSLREQLAFQFPYEPWKPMPKFIWQTWKVGPEELRFPSQYRNYIKRWETMNPDYVHKVLPDEACHELVRTMYSTVPDVLKAYELMPHLILKADFFRYLVVFARGGTYSDIDTFSLKKIDSWVSSQEKIMGKDDNPAGLVIGIEADPDRPDWNDWYARRLQFCQWTFQGKRGHPLLASLIIRITKVTLERIETGGLALSKDKDQGSDIMDWTGPGIFSDAIFEYLNNLVAYNKVDVINYNKPVEVSTPYTEEDKKQKIGWRFFTGMESPILIDDVLVLPITSFSPGVGQMGAKEETDELAYVKHMFLGSWKQESS